MNPLTPIEQAFAPLIARSPQLALEAARIIARAIDMAVKSRKIADPTVWMRAMFAASSEFASEKLAKKWRRYG